MFGDREAKEALTWPEKALGEQEGASELGLEKNQDFIKDRWGKWQSKWWQWYEPEVRKGKVTLRNVEFGGVI